jgi:ribulose-5-phosphate 4-epimerase/fuculose-1-phosphate aldolase
VQILMGLDGKWAHDERKPSSEFKIHLDLYKNRCAAFVWEGIAIDYKAP